MSRNLVICCDGTNNQFGQENTNIVRLVQSLDRNPDRQCLYYDAGLGTLPEPNAFTRWQKTVSDISQLALGRGLDWKVSQAYAFLMEMWQPGDQVYLFGFSRGAYTVRVLAALLHSLGLLPKGNPNLIPYVTRLFGSVRGSNPSTPSPYWKLCNQFRWTFARRVRSDEDQRHFPVHFLGVWDTVSSVGWFWNPKSYPYTQSNPSIATVRHAVALDERRCFYRQNLLKPYPGQSFRELWFPGVHSDVGGGYPEDEGSLWSLSFEWMIEEARNAGLAIDESRLTRVLDQKTDMVPWSSQIHESLDWKWWWAEYLPKRVWRRETKHWTIERGKGRSRRFDAPIELDRSVLLRIRGNVGYAPPNLSPEFQKEVKALTLVPETMMYTPPGVSAPAEKHVADPDLVS